MQAVIWSSNLLDTVKSLKNGHNSHLKANLLPEERAMLTDLKEKKEEGPARYWD